VAETMNDNLPAAAASPQPCEDKPYSFAFDKERDTWVCSIHGDVESTAWVPCFAGCDDGLIDEYEDDPINETPGTYSRCPECRGKGGWRVCGECNLSNPDAEF
jgi:hypothetical protein